MLTTNQNLVSFNYVSCRVTKRLTLSDVAKKNESAVVGFLFSAGSTGGGEKKSGKCLGTKNVGDHKIRGNFSRWTTIVSLTCVGQVKI